MTGRVIVTGAGGQLGRELVQAFLNEGHEVHGLARADLDIADPAAGSRIAAWEPSIVVNAAAWTDVDGCARDPQRAMLLNGVAPGLLAAGAAQAGALFVQISTNEVFAGDDDTPYAEGDEPHPINPYGQSKLAGEQAVAEAAPHHLIVRTAWLFGPGGTNFVTKILAAAGRANAERRPLLVVEDEWGNPTWTRALASAIAGLATADSPTRIVHLAGTPPTNRLEWARVALGATGSGAVIEPTTRAAFPRASSVPARSVLRPTDGLAPLSWIDETRAYARSASSASPHPGAREMS